MKDIMIDIETMGVWHDAAILSIAMVVFDPVTGETFEEFNQNIDIRSCLDAGMKAEVETIKWWLQQSDLARESIDITCENNLEDVLNEAAKFLYSVKANHIWAKSPSFDLVILRYQMDKLKVPYYDENTLPYYKERDVRTITDLLDDIEKEGASHVALEDCKAQIRNVVKALKKANHYQSYLKIDHEFLKALMTMPYYDPSLAVPAKMLVTDDEGNIAELEFESSFKVNIRNHVQNNTLMGDFSGHRLFKDKNI